MTTHSEEESRWRHRTRHYPESFQDDYVLYMQSGDLNRLNSLALGIIDHHIEGITSSEIQQKGQNLKLKTDLGTDSIALAEVVFAVEELFDVNINNQDLASLETLHDLAEFIKRKHASS